MTASVVVLRLLPKGTHVTERPIGVARVPIPGEYIELGAQLFEVTTVTHTPASETAAAYLDVVCVRGLPA
jgi:hypothetical protein